MKLKIFERSVLDFGGTGPNLLLCNANGFHALCYYELAKHLVHHFHCFAVDLRGTGDSCLDVADEVVTDALEHRNSMLREWLKPSAVLPTIEGYAEDICSIVKHLSWKELFLFGHSSGGCAVLAAIPKLAGAVKAAYIHEPVTIDPFKLRKMSVIAPASKELARRALKRRPTFNSREQAVEAFASRAFKNFDRKMLVDYVSYGFKPIADGSGIELKCSRNCEAVVFALVERMAAEHFHALADIRCPVVVGAGVGGFGGAEMADRSEIVARQLGNGRLERMDLSHFAPFEDPRKFAGCLLKALLPSRQSRL